MVGKTSAIGPAGDVNPLIDNEISKAALCRGLRRDPHDIAQSALFGPPISPTFYAKSRRSSDW
jgi:hypothetical protein